ncbi:MAG: C1 family peptidase [Candidatus Sumerlaeota bacterium]
MYITKRYAVLWVVAVCSCLLAGVAEAQESKQWSASEGMVVLEKNLAPVKGEAVKSAGEGPYALGRIATNREYEDPAANAAFKRYEGRGYRQSEMLTSHSLADFIPPIGDQGEVGSCVSWSMGYYYLSFLARKAESDPSITLSPYFAWRNGGSYAMANAADLFKAWGCCTLDTMSSYDDPTSSPAISEAQNFQIMGALPFWTRRIRVVQHRETGDRYFLSRYRNNINLLKMWLSGDWPYGSVTEGGEVVTLGIPVFDSFFSYSPSDPPYNVTDPLSDTFAGLHAVTVVGFDDEKEAFLVANSWGTLWGDEGFMWLSYDFVRRYADEAWRMYYTDDNYLDYYYCVLNGEVADGYDDQWTTGGLVISGSGHESDAVKIIKKPGVAFAPSIASVRSEGGFKVFMSQAPIEDFATSGVVKNFVGYAAELELADFNSIRMMARPNSVWAYQAQAVADYDFDYFFNDYQATEIRQNDFFMDSLESGGAMSTPGILQCVGVSVDDLQLPGKDLRLIAASKKFRDRYAPDYRKLAISESYFSYDLSGEKHVSAAELSMICNAAGVWPQSINVSGNLDLISNRGMLFTSPGFVYRMQGDIFPDTFDVRGNIGRLQAIGGDIVTWDTSRVGGYVNSMISRILMYRLPDRSVGSQGGEVVLDAVFATGYAPYASSDPRAGDILRIHGDYGVYFDNLSAGYDSEPNFTGNVHVISQKYSDGFFEGDVFCSPDVQTRLITGVEPHSMVIHNSAP